MAIQSGSMANPRLEASSMVLNDRLRLGSDLVIKARLGLEKFRLVPPLAEN